MLLCVVCCVLLWRVASYGGVLCVLCFVFYCVAFSFYVFGVFYCMEVCCHVLCLLCFIVLCMLCFIVLPYVFMYCVAFYCVVFYWVASCYVLCLLCFYNVSFRCYALCCVMFHCVFFCFVLFCSVLFCYILFCGSRSTAVCPSTVQGVRWLNSFHSSVILTEDRNKQSMKHNSGLHERMEQYTSTSFKSNVYELHQPAIRTKINRLGRRMRWPPTCCAQSISTSYKTLYAVLCLIQLVHWPHSFTPICFPCSYFFHTYAFVSSFFFFSSPSRFGVVSSPFHFLNP